MGDSEVDSDDTEEIEQQNSLLTDTQREFLRMSEEERRETYSKQMRSYHLRSIRDRLRAGMADALLILRRLDAEDIHTALEWRSVPSPGDYGDDIAVENGMSGIIGLIYFAGRERGYNAREREKPESFVDASFVEKRAEKGLRMAINRLGRSTEAVDVTIRITLGEEFDELADLSPQALADYSMGELQQAHLEGLITDEQFFGAMEEQGRVVFRDGVEDADE